MGCHFLLQCMKVKSESEVTQYVSRLLSYKVVKHIFLILKQNIGLMMKILHNLAWSRYSVYVMNLLSRKLGMSNQPWPGRKGCKLISKPHPRHTQKSSEIHYKNNHRDFSNSCRCTLGTQWIQLTTGASPTLAHAPLMHSSVLK